MQQQGAVNMESSHVPQQFKRTKLRHILLQQPEPSPATTTMKPSCPPPHFPDFPTTPSKTVIDSSLLLSSPSLSMNYDTTVLTDNRYYLNTSNNISCLSQQQQGLCLSLSSQSQHNNSPLMSGVVSTRSDFSASSVPLGPFTGYASVLNRSRLLKPAQQLLDDFCYGSRGDPPHCFGGKAAWISCDDDDIDPPIPEQKWNNNNNSSLIQLLEEVFKRYKLYCQQIQSVIASFESVSGLGNAAPYFIFAFKSMSKHFSCLKTAIVEQVHRLGNFEGNDGESKSSMVSVNRKPVRNLPFLKHHVWRSQRGLPSRAVVVLKKWLFEHFLHPYPSDADKQMLAQQTGLSRTQVSNWFINARVRLWKPMVEEIHGLETHKAPVPSEPRSPRAIQSMGYQISSNALSLKPSSLMYRTNMEEDHISGTSAYRRRAADNADISLALGLQQNHFPGGRAFLHGHFLPS